MNVFDKFAIKNIDKAIKEGFDLRNNSKEFPRFKSEINKTFGIFFINYMTTKDKGIFTVMCKRKNYTYIYQYNSTTNDLILKGERRNANT